MIEHNAYMMESSDFIVDFGGRQQEPVKHLDVVSHDEYFGQNNSTKEVAPPNISSALDSKKGINNLEENHIDYFEMQKTSIRAAS